MKESAASIFRVGYPEDGVRNFLLNVGNVLPNYLSQKPITFKKSPPRKLRSYEHNLMFNLSQINNVVANRERMVCSP
jgi:hypothetical protein